MLSSLSRGYGSWTGDVDVRTPMPQDASLPSVDLEHRHGVTVTPRSKGTPVIIPVAEDGQLTIPKTFATRKGALMLFTAPDAMPKEVERSRRPTKRKRREKDVLDLSLKLKTLERLSLSVLQFGDKLYDKDTSSISDKENKLMLNFLHDLNQENDDMDLHSQPGGDYKFYLRDLKRRASCRGHGVGDTTPQRARSVELQEILDDLEATWPKYSQSYRKDSTFTGSVASGDFLYPPESPAPSTLSTRSTSRGKILSCKKLTASLKSLTNMGRPASTEPDTRSIVNDSFMASTQLRFGDPRRSKSSVWISEASSPAYFQQSRPLTSHNRSQSALAQRTSGHKLMTSPEPSEVGAPDVIKSQNMWVEMDNQGDMSFISDDGHSLVSGADSEFRASDRGQTMTPVKEERMSTPSKGGDRDAMLAEAASVLSSLVEEEDIDLPDGRDVAIKSQPETQMVAIGPDNFFIRPRDDITLDDTDASRWAGLTETEDQSDVDGLRSRMSSRSKTPKLKSALGDDVDMDHVAQPLQPPYSGPMTRENRSTSPMDVGGEEIYKATQEDSSPYLNSRSASAEPGAEDPQILFSSGRGDSVTSRTTTPAPRIDTPLGLSGHSEGMIQEVSQILSDVEQIRASSVLGSASVSSTDKHAQDPDTLVSVFGHKDTGEYINKPQSPSASQVMKSSSPLPLSPSPTAENAVESVDPPSAMTTTTSIDMPKAATPEQQLIELPVTEVIEESEEEEFIPEPLAPKRRERKEEPKTPKPEGEIEEGEVVDEGEAKVEEEAAESTELSERVKKEMEEREQRLIKQKEEKEAEEARIKDEEEMKKQAAEDKRKAAEERIRLKAEELAKKKEEERLLKEQMPPVPEEESKKGAKAKKGKAKGSKQEPVTEEKKYVNALDITALQTGDVSKEGNTMDLLNKLKSSNKDVDLPVDKIQEFMKAQTPKVKQEPEKKEVHVPEHIKEMFNRRTNSQAQEELEQGIAKMRNAVNDALGGSVLQEESVEGLSVEEFEAAQEALKEKLKQAEEQMLDAVTSGAGTAKKSATPRVRKQEKKGSPTRKKKGSPDQAIKSDLAKEREAKKEQQRLEKQKRLEEVKELQQKINMKEEERKAKEREAKRKAEELKEHMDSIKREEEELERAEQDAREQLAAVRKAQREEREARRKADLEKKKQDAINRREKEKAMIEQAREKEQEMLDRIADAEMARRLREEEEAKREEEEQAAQERYEAEMKEAQRLAEEEEEKLRELERQAEEEAFQRLMDEREAAEEKRLQLEREAARMREEEEKQNLAMLEEEKRLEAERKKHEEEEEMRREQERERLRELQRLEEEAREKMRAELEKRRQWAMRRREYNLEQRANLDAIRQCQGVTDAWTFSYFVRWPKESYHRPMGHDPKKKPGAPRPKPKPSTQQGSTNTQSAVDVAALP